MLFVEYSYKSANALNNFLVCISLVNQNRIYNYTYNVIILSSLNSQLFSIQYLYIGEIIMN